MTNSHYRPDIDGLRAIAILSVVAYHVGLPGVSGGFTGVDVFFVISGFLITQLLYRELDNRGTISIAGFYARRARRLLPALTVVLCFTLVLGAFLLPPFGEKVALSKSAIAAVGFVANEFFRMFSGGYFDGPAALVPLLHLWSLSVEEQFYLVWPWVFIGIAALVAAPRRRLTLILGIAGASLGSFVLSALLTGMDSSYAFYFIGSRAWELGAGAVLALALADPKSGLRPAWLGALSTAGGVCVMGVGFFWLRRETPFPGFAALLPVAGTAMVIYGNTLAPASFVARALSSKPMMTLGLLSYSWYLWHWPILALARSRRLGEADLVIDVFLGIGALALAWLTLQYVENPIRYGKTARSAPRKTLAFGAAALAGITALAAGLWTWAELAPKSQEVQRAFEMAIDQSPHQANCSMAPRRWGGVVPLPKCTIGAPGEQPVLAIWGDSHADAWSPLLEEASRSSQQAYVQVSMNSCPPLLGLTPIVPTRGIANCRPFNDAVLQYLQSQASLGLKGVVLTARWSTYSGSPNISVDDDWVCYADQSNRTAAEALASLESGLTATLSALRASNLRVLILLSQPEFRHPPYRCILVRPTESCGIERDIYERHRAAVNGVIESLAAGFENVRVVDPVDYFCDERYCPPFLGTIPSQRDDDHVSASAARNYAAVIAADLAWLTHQNESGR